jgi:CheY-like chemotaxis protein
MMLHGERASILLVEDDPDDVLLVKRALELAGARITLAVARDGDEAVAYLGGARRPAGDGDLPLPCLVLLDLKLPRRSGHEVLEWLRGQPVLRRLPVIVLTSSDQQRDIDHAYDLGVNSYLVKPVRSHACVEVLRHLVKYWVDVNHPPGLREPPGLRPDALPQERRVPWTSVPDRDPDRARCSRAACARRVS